MVCGHSSTGNSWNTLLRKIYILVYNKKNILKALNEKLFWFGINSMSFDHSTTTVIAATMWGEKPYYQRFFKNITYRSPKNCLWRHLIIIIKYDSTIFVESTVVQNIYKRLPLRKFPFHEHGPRGVWIYVLKAPWFWLIKLLVLGWTSVQSYLTGCGIFCWYFLYRDLLLIKCWSDLWWGGAIVILNNLVFSSDHLSY